MWIGDWGFCLLHTVGMLIMPMRRKNGVESVEHAVALCGSWSLGHTGSFVLSLGSAFFRRFLYKVRGIQWVCLRERCCKVGK